MRYKVNFALAPRVDAALRALEKNGSYANAKRAMENIMRRQNLYVKLSRDGHNSPGLRAAINKLVRSNENFNDITAQISNARKKQLAQLKNHVQKMQWAKYATVPHANLNNQRNNLIQSIHRSNGTNYRTLEARWLRLAPHTGGRRFG
jgi:hypothetical protein